MRVDLVHCVCFLEVLASEIAGEGWEIEWSGVRRLAHRGQEMIRIAREPFLHKFACSVKIVE